MNSNLVNLITWSKPIYSAAYLIFINICFWFLQRQRPVCVISIALLLYYLRSLWKNRIRPTILVDPPDNEDWVTLSSYEMEKSTVDFGKSLWKSWLAMRSENYFIWILLTSIFWISLAKLATHVSFLTVLFVISNGGFLAGPLLKNLRLDMVQTGTASDEFTEDISVTELRDAAKDLLQEVEKKSSSSSKTKFDDNKSKVQEIVLGTSSHVSQQTSEPQPPKVVFDLHHQDLREATANRDDDDDDDIGSFRRSATPQEPESLTPYGAVIPNHDDSSEDEFLFDGKHFESSDSSTSNSFELIHF